MGALTVAYASKTYASNLKGTRLLVGLLLAIAVLALQAGQGTQAYFTSTATSSGNTFSSGTVTLKLSDVDETDLATVTASVGSAAFKPGDTAAGYVTVKNAGTASFDYGLKYTATNTTGTLWVAGATNPTLAVYTAAATANCTAANAAGAKTGLTSAYGAASVATAANTVVFDSAGGSKRTLAAAGSEILCLVVTWPNGAAGAENAQMGATGKIDLAFDAR